MFRCEIIKWEEHAEKYRRRSNNWLKCIDEDAKIEYDFLEPYYETVLAIKRENLATNDTYGPTLCYKCIEELKRFLNENIRGPITCNCAPFPIVTGIMIEEEERPQIEPMRAIIVALKRQILQEYLEKYLL
jgi:hypothetical protein